MIEFLAWCLVLFIQALVHIKVAYLRRGRDDDEPRLIERDSSTSSEVTWPPEDDKKKERATSILSQPYSNPALDDDDLDLDFDEPPNLKHRLSQTGSEMMNVSFASCARNRLSHRRTNT